ncbi:MAG: ATP-dependent zinc metalloprotease FtsH [Rhodoferax sp.]|uniref:ATP-dependent zinc metalloprotease FtsH n=2 Tax=Rhodoferax sp. TaxID=50421 RepID=UPI002731474B|nr:ATP-dependent zinc metalloprotease FtsH [Rhodoferax sp.]MDP1529475.1 ATP-dependent zinc metalloprotease FtsH [Rhodoferax sp.]MDP1943938.1 ATP-dependent zinc metalloprotease FtsH [Rhodoferax sp.]MDP2441703.1 ATP-dependent zinc metalloprotease FtsH [Rhodoferax sp.]MDP3190630.1 ATP-dependent zinc metalloprotease FtsH [Rhodoferax sp.]MDP3864425.1 ATP-dependent zinc metalloprotease FtsH [Rhodoferax sp.]
MNNPWFSKIAVWMVIAMVLFTVFKQFDARPEAGAGYMGYSDFLEEVRGSRIKSAIIQEGQGGTEIVAVTTDDRKVRTTATYLDRGLVGDLIANDVKFDVRQREEGSLLMTLLVSWGPMLLLIGVWVYFMRQMQGGGKGGAFSFGKSKARLLDENTNTVTFADVAGCDEAKEEVKEVVDFLKDPAKFQKLGGRIPRGLLLVGPPGTGKTLLAKSIAGEAKVPFFSISGSDFVEMFVGVGASRVRDMFDNAKKNAPCIIFIDEIDAVGRQRGAGLGGGNDEREQTLNQMLVEMDGFETNVGVIVVAATNRPDILDAALLRPGRFDRQVYVTLPDIRGREQILNVHMRKIPLNPDVNAGVIARGTPGMSGADLANLCNEAALMAARRNARTVEMQDFEKAKDKILMGPERKSMVMPESERRNTAYHESGHALIGKLLPKCDPVHKVTIIPRGRALGVTMSLPAQDRYSYDKEYMLNQISMLFGGRIAEEVFMNQMTTGASNDFERATHIARDMVMRYGMTAALGPMVYAENEGEVFLGRSVTKTTNMSEETMQKVDAEVRRIIDEQYALARRLIEEHSDHMHVMAKALLEWETIDSDQLDDIMAGKPPRPPKDWSPRVPPASSTDTGSGGTPAVNPDAAPHAA